MMLNSTLFTAPPIQAEITSEILISPTAVSTVEIWCDTEGMTLLVTPDQLQYTGPGLYSDWVACVVILFLLRLKGLYRSRV